MSEAKIKPGTNYEAWRVSPYPEGADKDPGIALRHFAEVAVLAPSSHNTQPWQFTAASQELMFRVFLDKSQVLPVSDPTGKEAYISVGAALENVLQAAQALSWKTDATYFPEGLNSNMIASVQLQQTTETNASLYPQIFQRSMHRGKFSSSKMLPINVAKEFRSIATLSREVELNLITDQQKKLQAADLVARGNLAALAKDSFRIELSRYLLPNDTICERGMPGDTFGMPQDFVEVVRRQLSKEGPFDSLLSQGFAQGDKDAISNASAIAIIAAEHATPLSWVLAGQLLQRACLLATKHNFAVAVSTGAIEDTHSRRYLQQLLSNKRKEPTVFFRIGYPEAETTHSPRVLAPKLTKVF